MTALRNVALAIALSVVVEQPAPSQLVWAGIAVVAAGLALGLRASEASRPAATTTDEAARPCGVEGITP